MPRRDEEDDDEFQDPVSDEEERGGRTVQRRKKRRLNTLLDIEAEEEEAEDDDEEGDIQDLIADDDPEADQDRQAARAQYLQHQQALDTEDPEEILRRFQARYDDEDDADQAAPDTSGIDQQSLLPTIRDPRLYIVRIRKPGHERRAVLTLLQKYFDLKRKGVDIGIVSAVAPEHLKGIVYVEATNATSVEFACAGLDLFNMYPGIKALALDEMTDVLKVAKRLDKQQPGNWIRRTRGVYKGDLAQVVRVTENDNVVQVRTIPRIDIKSERDVMENADEDYNDDDENGPTAGLLNGKRRGRPPQRLFDKKEIYRLTGSRDIYQQRDTVTGEIYDSWNSETYRHGLIYQKVSVKTLVTGDDVQPQVEEVEKWIVAEKRMRLAYEEDPDNYALTSEEIRKGLNIQFTSATGGRKTGLFKGDSVHVIKGEQKGLTGVIAGIDGDVVLMQVNDFPEPLRVSREDLVKTFEAGDNVKVAAGKHAGQSGAIVSVDGEFLTIFTDSTKKEIRVLSSHVADSNDLNVSGRQSNAAVQSRVNYGLFELVTLVDDNKKAVVLKVENDSVTVLNSQNQLLNVPFAGIRAKQQDRSARGHDARGNPIAPNDSINVIAGAAKDRYGTVLHVAGPTVFFSAKDEIKNCGVIAVLASYCIAATAAARRLNHSLGGSRNMYNAPAPIPRGSIASLGSGGLTGGGRGGGGRGVIDPLMRKQVKVTQGNWKGYLGTVIYADAKLVQVQLAANMKTVRVARSKVRDLEDQGSNGVGGAKTSSFSGLNRSLSGLGSGQRPSNQSLLMRTPRSNSYMQTPNPGMMSRRYGSSTPAPSYGTTTPHRSLDSGFTPRAHQTPRLSAFRAATPSRQDEFRPKTPVHRPSTSANNNPYADGPSFGRPSYPRQSHTPMPSTPAMENANEYASYSRNGVPQTPSAANDVSTPAPFSTIVEPSTPANNMVPHTPGPFGGVAEPRTPANIIEPSTPAPLGAEPRTPAPGMEPATPAPGMEPTTPAPGLEPRTPMMEPTTPHTPAVPQTPMVEEDSSGSLGYKVLIDVVVSVSTENQNSGVVLDAAVDGSYVVVKMIAGPKSGQTIRLAGSDITPVQPRSEIIDDDLETVKVLDRQYQGKIGHLTSVRGDENNPDGVVKFQDGSIGVLSLSLVAKCEEISH